SRASASASLLVSLPTSPARSPASARPASSSESLGFGGGGGTATAVPGPAITAASTSAPVASVAPFALVLTWAHLLLLRAELCHRGLAVTSCHTRNTDTSHHISPFRGTPTRIPARFRHVRGPDRARGP